MDIETATIDELYEEIESRCKGCVLILKKPLKNTIDETGIFGFVLRWKDFPLSLGLVEQAKFWFHRHYLDTYEDIPPSEAGLEE